MNPAKVNHLFDLKNVLWPNYPAEEVNIRWLSIFATARERLL